MDEQKNNVIEEQTINKMEEYKEERTDLAAFSEKGDAVARRDK